MTATEYEAYKTVDSYLDDGDKFHRKCMNLDFARAVEKARELRAYAPGLLRSIVVNNKG